jgi:hypothetical protein
MRRLPAPRAARTAILTLARRGPTEEQAGHVGRGDEEDERHRRGEEQRVGLTEPVSVCPSGWGSTRQPPFESGCPSRAALRSGSGARRRQRGWRGCQPPDDAQEVTAEVLPHVGGEGRRIRDPRRRRDDAGRAA